MPDRVRLGVLGLGAVAQAVHLPILERLADRFEVAAVADLSPSLAAVIGERCRVAPSNRFSTLDAMLDGASLDGLLILSSGSHGAAILAGLDHGLAVFTEKPLAWTLAEADAIAARLADDPGARLQVGYMKLYDPAAVEAMAVAADTDRVGPIRSIEVCVLHPSSESQLEHARLLPPPTDIAPGSLEALGSKGIGCWRSRSARPRHRSASSIRTSSSGASSTTWRSSGGLPAIRSGSMRSMSGRRTGGRRRSGSRAGSPGMRGSRSAGISCPTTPAYREEVRVVTERATIELEFPTPYLLNAPTELRIAERAANGRRDTQLRSLAEAFDKELVAFHALVVDGTEPLAGLRDGRADIVTSQRIATRHAEQLGIPIRTEAPD